ncbi:hypothetical protein GR925_03035 [Streptomyces sp. HUCO-GS316]|uniref:hypothetical protein n=1 Tax=Streptomyces sp. HUCO-GS316 TaxID=2692198 RepID=UPI00136B0A44|nr:hypothetical protein [Streptomyces sp. HUCO-GS316]MXM62449.1 hypothetical protein [Streptomyces sp. HUCO-GS316]
MGEQTGGARFRVRDGFGLAGVLVVLAALLAVFLLVFGAWRRFARAAMPVLVDLPGGSWAVGAVLGLGSVLGWVGGGLLGFAGTGKSDEAKLLRVVRIFACSVCWVAALGPVMLLFSGLPGKNCRSSEVSCAYIPGTGTAFLAYIGTVAVVGWLCFRWRSSVVEARKAAERERMRKLRKKGKGRSRAARTRS